MTHIKKFNESKLPQYIKGEILIFSHEDGKYLSELIKRMGYKLIGPHEYSDDCFIVKTDIGKEMLTGEQLKTRYPEYISDYQRRDIRFENFQKGIDETEDLIDDLNTIFGENNFLGDEWNSKIDEIISLLNGMKV